MVYPTKIRASRVYDINTDYRVALDCFRAIYDDSINETERALAVVTLLLGKDVKAEDYEICLEKCAIYLRCGQEENASNDEVDMDYFQDEACIKESIRQCYHLDIDKESYIHWWEYNNLIKYLTENTALSVRRELRSLDLSEITDDKRRRELESAKEKVKLKRYIVQPSKEEIESINNFYRLARIDKVVK